MKKYLLLFSIISLQFLSVHANDDNPPVGIGLITGSVYDAASNEPMPYVNVVVRDNKDSILTGGITDDKGNFEITAIPEGNNKVEIQFIGYEKITKEIDVSLAKSRHNLSSISLNESSQHLDEVVVRGELSTVTQKIDRKVINVGKDLTATGVNASELLNNVQSVSVDGQTGQISLRGNENVKILVDGRPTNVSAAQLLRQIPSSSIKSIELITNPSAKYNPEGMSGIINIVLYKNATLGLNGSINGGVSVGKNVKYNGALDINYRKGKINLFANYGGNTGQSEGGGEVWRRDNNAYSLFLNENDNTSHLLKVGADVYINKTNTLSVYTSQNLYDGYRLAQTLIHFEEVLDSDNLNENVQDNYTGTYNLNFLHDFSKAGHNMEFEVSHSVNGQLENGAYSQLLNPGDKTANYLDDIHNEGSSSMVNLDYTNPVSENAKLEIGLETRFTDTRNQYNNSRHHFLYDDNFKRIPDGNEWFLTAPIGNASFTYDQNIYSAYTNYNQRFGKFDMQAGIRVEQYEVEAAFIQAEEAESYKDEKLTAYPSAFITYALSEKNQFQVSFSRRVDRPGINQVNPIRSTWSSPLVVFVGNPELRPQFTNSYEINYTRRLKKGSVSMGTFFRRLTDNIVRYSNQDLLDPNKIEITFTNAESADRFGFEMSGMYRPSGWWNINASFDLYSQQLTGYAFGDLVEINSVATNVRLNNSFKVTDNLSFQLFGMYRGANETIQWTFKPMWMINSGVSLKVFQKKGTISLRVNDLFNTMRFGFESTNFFPSNGVFNWESRTAYVGYSHTFGQGDFKARKLRKRENGEFSSGGGGGF